MSMGLDWSEIPRAVKSTQRDDPIQEEATEVPLIPRLVHFVHPCRSVPLIPYEVMVLAALHHREAGEHCDDRFSYGDDIVLNELEAEPGRHFANGSQ
jgi:hypothetical protein